MKKISLFLVGALCVGASVYYLKPEWIHFLKSGMRNGAISEQCIDEKNFTHEPTLISHLSDSLPNIHKTQGVYTPQVFKLKNGLEVVVISNPRSPVVKQTVFYRVGSIDDPRGKSGIAHFLEHLMFQGKTKYAAPKEFDKIIKRLGAVHNAFTTFDITAYYEQAPKEALEEIIKLEAGRMEELYLTNDLVLPERDVILEERSMRIDNDPKGQLGEATMRALYQTSPMGRHPIGWRHEMAGLTLEDAVDFHYHWYCPNNAVVVFVGDVTVDEVRPLVEKYYAPISARPIKKRMLLLEPPYQGVQMRLKKQSNRVDQPILQRLYKVSTLSYGDARSVFPMRVLEYILSNGQNSLLYKYFIKEKKLATSVSFGSLDDVIAPGYATFVLLPAPGVTLETLEAALESFIQDILQKGISAKEVESAKRRMLATFKYAKDNVFSGSEIGATLARGRSMDEVEYMPDYLNAVTTEDVNKYMRDFFKREDFVTSQLLPETSKEKEGKQEKSEMPKLKESPESSKKENSIAVAQKSAKTLSKNDRAPETSLSTSKEAQS